MKTPLQPTNELPDPADAARKLDSGHGRAVLSLLLRLVSVAFLIALLSVQLPAVRRALPLANALGVALIAWPYFTSTGRLHGWRIGVGRRYAEAGQWEAAAQMLEPLVGIRAALFDARGEGRYHLAAACAALGRADDAARLRGELSSQYAGSEWGKRASADLAGAKS